MWTQKKVSDILSGMGKLGRPPSQNPKDRVIQVRLTKAERAALDAKAHEAGQNASDYIRTVAIAPKEA